MDERLVLRCLREDTTTQECCIFRVVNRHNQIIAVSFNTDGLSCIKTATCTYFKITVSDNPPGLRADIGSFVDAACIQFCVIRMFSRDITEAKDNSDLVPVHEQVTKL